MDKFKKDDNIMSGKGENDVTWVTLNGAHIPIKDGESLENSLKDLTKPKKKSIIFLPSEEYGALCHKLDTRYANNIPEKGGIYIENYYYRFEYDKEEDKITCSGKVQIVGNEDLINLLEELEW